MPSGDQANPSTRSVRQVYVCRRTPCCVSHTCISLPLSAEASRCPSGDQATACTSLASLREKSKGLSIFLTFQILIVRSKPAEASRDPSGDQVNACIKSV